MSKNALSKSFYFFIDQRLTKKRKNEYRIRRILQKFNITRPNFCNAGYHRVTYYVFFFSSGIEFLLCCISCLWYATVHWNRRSCCWCISDHGLLFVHNKTHCVTGAGDEIPSSKCSFYRHLYIFLGFAFSLLCPYVLYVVQSKLGVTKLKKSFDIFMSSNLLFFHALRFGCIRTQNNIFRIETI